MKKLAIVSALCVSSAALSGAALANHQVTYSTEGYCALDDTSYKTEHQKLFLKAYSEKLGTTPSKSFCKELRMEKFSTLPKADRSWNYSFNKPYPGSVIRLSSKTVKQLKAKKVLAKDILASR